MQKTALVIMAAGIGSRFGKGIKQLLKASGSDCCCCHRTNKTDQPCQKI